MRIHLKRNSDILVGNGSRFWAVVIVLLVSTTVFASFVPETRAQPLAEFTGVFTERTTDIEPDGLYNELIIGAEVDVFVAGEYEVYGSLRDSFFNYIDSDYNSTYLDVGTHTVEISFTGFKIRNNGVDGPYEVYVDLYATDPWEWLDSDFYTTQFYAWGDFQTPPAEFKPPHSDYGLDMDGDGLYEYLVINVTVNVTTDGRYTVDGDLYDDDWDWIDYKTKITTLTEGLREVKLFFSGWTIYDHGYSGIFAVELDLRDISNELVDSDTHYTQYYSFDQFNSTPPAEFYPPYSDYGLDMDGNTFYDYLVVNVSLNVHIAGTYVLVSYLYDGSGTTFITSSLNITYLDIGIQTIPIYFVGPQIFESGIDGPYDVEMYLARQIRGGMWEGIGYDYYMTSPYSHTDFDSSDTIPPTITSTIPEDGETEVPISTLIWIVFSEWMNSTSVEDAFSYTDGISVWNSTNGSWNWFGNTFLFYPFVAFQYSTTYTVTISTEAKDLSENNLESLYQFSFTTESIFWDTESPEISNVLVNGQPFIEVPEGTIVTLTARIDDSTTGGSDIGGANFTIGEGNWPSTDMNPQDGFFDSSTEVATFDVNTAGWAEGTYDLYVYGRDVVPNYNTTSTAYATIIIVPETRAPKILNVFVDSQPSQTYYLSSLPPTITLTATIDDVDTGNSNIGGANYTTPTPTSWPGTDMNAVLPPFDNSIEDATATIATPTLPGTYNYYVYAWDELGNCNNTAPFASLTIVDDLPPQISNVLVNGEPTTTVVSGASVILTAKISDTNTGGSEIEDANYTTGFANWLSSRPMSSADGAFDEALEDITATIDTTGWADGMYEIYVYGQDNLLNSNVTSLEYAIIVISTDTTPPEISNVLVDDKTSVTVTAGTSVTLTARIDDSTTGGSDTGGANFTVGKANWPSSELMSASDGAFDSPIESVTASIDTTDWQEGTFEICVYAWDAVLNNNKTSTACATIIIAPIITDTTPPTISDVKKDPDPQELGKIIKISANVTDDVEVDIVFIEIKDSEGNVVGNFSMAYDSVADRYELEKSFDKTGTYTFTIWAKDTSANFASSQGEFTIKKAEAISFLEQYWWVVLLIVVIIVIIMVAVLFLRRKGPVLTEELPPPPEELAEEEVVREERE